MKNIKLKRIHFIIASAVVVTGIAIVLIASILTNDGSVQKSLSLGDSYLSDLDYNSAIREYSNVLAIDPLNQDALVGLAKSYSGTGDVDMVNRIFEQDLADNQTSEVMRAYAEIKTNNGEYMEALQAIQKIVEMEDRDEDYEWLSEVLAKVMQNRHEYAESDTVTIAMKQNAVQTMGSNILGALGNNVNLGQEERTTALADAGFGETPASVYASGANSMVIDTQGKLWIAGSNRSGQKTDGVQMIANAGWTKVEELSGVVKAAGTDSTLFALTQTGDLWMRGENAGYTYGSAWQDQWTQISVYGKVLDIQCVGNNVLLHTLAGDVYRNQSTYYNSYYQDGLNWELQASDIAHVSYEDNNLICVDAEGVVRYYNYASFPYGWEYYDANGYWVGYKIPYEVADVAAVEDGIYILTDERELYWVKDGQCNLVSVKGEVESIYTLGNQCVAQWQNGGYGIFDSSGYLK